MTLFTHSRIGVSLPMLNQPYERYPEFAALADDAGFDSVWDYEFYRNPFITHALNARATSRIQLGTGIATAAPRTPYEMANAAADVDELSGGRALLGLGTGGAGWMECFNGTDIDRPLKRIREYVHVVRQLWSHFETDEPFSFQGEIYRASSPPVNPWGTRNLVRPQIPIYLAGLKQGMLRLAGEVGDGVLGFLPTPTFIQQHVLPNVAAGAAKVGRDPSEIDVTALVICSVSDDREAALRRARINVGNYVAYPVSSTVIEFMGLQEDRDHVLRRLLEEGPAALATAASDALVQAFSVAGTPDEVADQLVAYDGVLPHIVLHTPYVPPIDQASSEDAFRSMVRAFARVNA
ncbi:luciferase-like protein [Mycobacterium lentiflavum]|uniref:Luciferase-like protein n=1 Tax=Mycobacterium lentiflavum TaxID=141349 RepID=A0A0E4CPH9_MYCLN|nr:LLM class flavin-dependent oxidoreductase [Mycobacterium lentiflavum]CQD18135.1 luciferase-like protein [Mycobacterium lentiflavum]